MDDQRPLPRQGLEQPAHGPGDVVCGGRADSQADGLRERERRFLPSLGPRQQRDHALQRPFGGHGLLDARGLLQQLAQRPVGDPLPVGEAPAAEDRRLPGDRGHQLRGEP